MNIQLTPGFTANIEIKDLNGASLHQENFNSDQDLKDFIVKYGKSKPGWSLLEGLVKPLRMDSWQHFAEDFFFPTFVHYALKVNHIALKVISSICAIALDVITLPIRFIMTPFCAFSYYNHPEPKHRIESDLGIAEHDLVVNLCYHKEETVVKAPFQDEQGNNLQNAKKSTYEGVKTIALKNLVGGIKEYSKEDEKITFYTRINGNWGIDKQTVGTSTVTHFG